MNDITIKVSMKKTNTIPAKDTDSLSELVKLFADSLYTNHQ